MIKLKEIEKIDDSTFKIKVLHDLTLKTFLVSCNYHFIDSLQEEMMYFNSDDNDFYDVWGQSFDFRKEVYGKIKQFREAEVSDLQAA